jgi:hypothetical protein
MPSNNPAVLSSLMPGANISGSNVAVPPQPMSVGSQSVGGNTNPFLPVTASGQAMPPMTSTSGTTPGATAPMDIGTLSGSGGQSLDSVIKALKKTGMPGGIAALLGQFLKSGAGFNPQVAQALINAMQPQIERGTENIVEQFSAMGNRFGSPAATGLADFEGQVQLDIGQIFAQLYEQSVTNYLSVLMGAGKKAPTFGSQFSGAFASGLGSGLGGLLTGT